MPAWSRARSVRCGRMPRHVVELGAGDGTLLLRVATASRPATNAHSRRARRSASVAERRNAHRVPGARMGHRSARSQTCSTGCCGRNRNLADVIIANLFLHHFRDGDLSTLLAAASRQATRFVACEPRRSHTALAGAALLLLVGCNDVTRHDADISVRAGFRDREISALWPNESGWHLTESRAGLFSHFFEARRV